MVSLLTPPPPERAASGRFGPSTLMMVAPMSARMRVVNGPAYTQVVSTTFSPSSGRGLALTGSIFRGRNGVLGNLISSVC